MKLLNRTILLVEDSQDDVFFMNRACKKALVTNPINVAQDGQEAIDYLSGEGKFKDRKQFELPAVVLLDLKLPHKNGLEVLQWIRSRPQFKTLIVVLLTSSRENRDVEAAYKLGANAFLVKPSHFDHLVEMLKAFKVFWIDQNEFPDSINSSET
ncbi:MAG: putative response regulator, CheY [Verrucomicrobiales bacterium]|nr:putative response regulator, CheY [Verrucomicrobiales bacterium]